MQIIKKGRFYLSRLAANIFTMRFILKRFSQIEKYLEEGKYELNFEKKTIFKKDLQIGVFFNNYLGAPANLNKKKSAIPGVFVNLFFLTVKTKEKRGNQAFSGNLALFSNKQKSEIQYGDLKIFDFEKKEILTSYFSAKSYQKKLNDTKYFSRFFEIPEVKAFNEKERITIEELIEFKPKKDYNSTDFFKTINYILDSHTEYFKESKKNKTFKLIKPASFFEFKNFHPVNQRNLSTIKSLIGEKQLQIELPTCYQHGDLSYSNILLSKTGMCYIIDWEHASDFTFLYDIMWPWQNEAINHNNFFLIERYFNGTFDIYMKNLFSAFDLEFCTEHRLTYLLIMIGELVWRRVLKQEPFCYNSFLNDKIIPFVKAIATLNKQ